MAKQVLILPSIFRILIRLGLFSGLRLCRRRTQPLQIYLRAIRRFDSANGASNCNGLLNDGAPDQSLRLFVHCQSP